MYVRKDDNTTKTLNFKYKVYGKRALGFFLTGIQGNAASNVQKC